MVTVQRVKKSTNAFSVGPTDPGRLVQHLKRGQVCKEANQGTKSILLSPKTKPFKIRLLSPKHSKQSLLLRKGVLIYA